MTIKGSILISIVIICYSTIAFAQETPIIYLFPGQGSDERLFDSLKFKIDYRIVHIEYPIPDNGSSLSAYAKRISKQIDTSQQYIFIGVSLGGMIISELHEFLNPEK
ncbi:hypothetical protein [Marivirga sp.]|uniref:alpha/beta fold hydrolase n=1 Tax=Marivirga sp. TaxID=2018662 RepID=UPI0025CE6611|nr:hypothetical protein [Marivirga sp.]